jgi:hypothetical protein
MISSWHHNHLLNLYFAFSASLSTVALMGPFPLPSVLSPPPDAIMPSSASPFSGSGGGTAFDERSTPEDAGVFDRVLELQSYHKVLRRYCFTYILVTCTVNNLIAFDFVVGTA